MSNSEQTVTAWFNGPKAENGDVLEEAVKRILQDYNYWRRNYYPEDGVSLDSSQRRQNEPFQDAFSDKLIELLGLLKADFPFQSPRYAAHMVAEQTMPSIVGYFAAMLYNPNNVTAEAAPVTLRLELEAAQMIARMLGYGDQSWAHLCSGGTLANIEAMWVARSVKYLPFVVADMREGLGLNPPNWDRNPQGILRLSPTVALEELERCFSEAKSQRRASTRECIDAYRNSKWNVAEQGVAQISSMLGSLPAILVPETAHYCFPKALDLIGIGKAALFKVPVDSDFRMRVDALSDRLDDLAAQGRHVLAVVTAVGTTEEGAVDPVNEIVALRRAREEQGLGSFWLHADGAYGGYLRTITVPTRLGLGPKQTKIRLGGKVASIDLPLPENSACAALESLGDCDSITIDPHKLGYIPYPAGAICFKSNLVKPIARQDAPYIEERPGSPATEKSSEGIGLYVLEGSKPGAAAAAVWMSHTLIPLDNTGHGILVRNAVRNACELHELLVRFGELARPSAVRAECLCPPGSNILCFAFRPTASGTSLREINRLNREVYEEFNVSRANQKRVYDQPFFLSRTTLQASMYSQDSVAPFLNRLGVNPEEFDREGVFLLRSVLMNPWYGEAKSRGRYFLSEMTERLYEVAEASSRTA